QLDATPTRREGRSAGAGPPRTARGVLRPAPGPVGAHHRVDLSGPGNIPRIAGAARRHTLASGPRTSPDGAQTRSDGRTRTQSAGGQTVLYEHRIRFGTRRIRAVHAS